MTMNMMKMTMNMMMMMMTMGRVSARPSSLADESHQTLWLPIVSTQSHLCQRIHLIGIIIIIIVIILNIIINERSHHPLTELESIMMIVSESRKGKWNWKLIFFLFVFSLVYTQSSHQCEYNMMIVRPVHMSKHPTCKHCNSGLNDEHRKSMWRFS